MIGFAQTEIKNEEFEYRLIDNKTKCKVLYIGKDHFFEIELKGNLHSNVEITGNNPSNNNFINLDKKLIQFTAIPITYNIIGKFFDLNKLSIGNQKQVLDSYLKYESDYRKNELGIKMKNYKLQETDDNGKLYYFLSYEIADYSNEKENTYKNIYLITIAYNQILSINIPLTKDNNELESDLFLKKLRHKIKFHNKKFKK